VTASTAIDRETETAGHAESHHGACVQPNADLGARRYKGDTEEDTRR
jgi:hypothetical protein